jgi:hypothetical protein
LLRSGGAHQIGDIAPAARQAGTQISAYRTGADDQNAHIRFSEYRQVE